MIEKERMEAKVMDALGIKTRELFPTIYEGFKEIEELAKAEDALLQVLKNIIYSYFNNRNMQTYTLAMIEAFENALGIRPQSQDIEARRSAIIERVNARFVNNDQTMEALAREGGGNDSIILNTDCAALKTEVTTETGSNAATFDELIAALRAIRPKMPQNIVIQAVDKTQLNKMLTSYGASRTVLAINAGHATPPTLLYAYFTTQGEAATTNTTFTTGYSSMYDPSGTRLSLEPEYEYKLEKFVTEEGLEMTPESMGTVLYSWNFSLTSNSSFQLSLYHGMNGWWGARYVVYSKTKATLRTAYLNADKTPQTVGPWSIKYLYDDNGNQINAGAAQMVDHVAYYYINGERFYNVNASGNPIVRMTTSGNKLQIGASSNIVIDKVEFSTQPGH